MKTYAPTQANTLAKTVAFFFFGFLILWAVTNYLFVGDVYLHWSLLVVNAILSLGLGWWYYKSVRHTSFAYDYDGFELHQAKNEVSRQWRQFGKASLLHLGHAIYAVRLYEKDVETASVDIPASALRLDPSAFRFEVMDLISGKAEPA